MKVLQLTNKTTNKIVGSDLLKPIHAWQFYREQTEECHEINAIIKVLKIRRGDKQDVIKDDIFLGKDDICSGIQVELSKYEKVVKEFKEMEQKFRQQEARENSGKRGQSET